MKINLLCRIFGHRWTYYKKDAQDFRVCRCCHQMNYWITFPVAKKAFWMITVQYKEKGAKAHVEGYGI